MLLFSSNDAAPRVSQVWTHWDQQSKIKCSVLCFILGRGGDKNINS